ncbi:DMT family transporter [Vibrio breoganii]
MLNRYYVCLFLASTFAGLGWLFSKEAMTNTPPLFFMGLRFLFSAAIIFPFCFRQLIKISPKQLLQATSSAIAIAIGLVLWAYSVEVSDNLGEGAFIMALSIQLAPVFAWLIMKARPQTQFFITLPISILGLFMLTSDKGLSFSQSQLYFLMTAILFSLYFCLNTKYASNIPILTLVFIQFTLSGILSLSISHYTEPSVTVLSNHFYYFFGLSIVVSSVFRFVLQTNGQKGLSTSTAAMIMILDPIWVLSLSVYYYDEVLTLSKVLGASLILISLSLYLSYPRILNYRIKQQTLRN